MQRRDFFKSLATGISSVKENNPADTDKKYVEESILGDSFFLSAKKIITRKESKPMLEEILIDELTSLEKADSLNVSPHFSSDELAAAFKPIIPMIHAFLDVGPVPDLDLYVLTPQLKREIQTGINYGLPSLFALLAAGSSAYLLRDKFTRRDLLRTTAFALIPITSGSIALTAGRLSSEKLGYLYDDSKFEGRYFSPLKLALIKDKERESQLATAVHEYTHHLQYRTGVGAKDSPFSNWNTNNILEEGHAIGVANSIITQLAEETKDIAYLPYIKKKNALLILDAYTWCCASTNQKPIFTNQEFTKLDKHSLGAAIFLMAEKKCGNGIYKATLKNDLSFFNELL